MNDWAAARIDEGGDALPGGVAHPPLGLPTQAYDCVRGFGPEPAGYAGELAVLQTVCVDPIPQWSWVDWMPGDREVTAAAGAMRRV